MKYLTYEQYNNVGGELCESAFNRNIIRACAMIDAATHNRIEKMKSIPEEVQALCRDIVEYLAVDSETSAPVTSRSESAGPVSQSVSYTIKTNDEQAADIDNMIYDYLISVTDEEGTPLLYRGCSG